MESLNFWKNWQKEYRYTWLAAAAIFTFSLFFLWYSYFQGTDGVIHWNKFQEQRVVETTVHSFRLGPFELTVPGESYVIFEFFNGSNITPNTTASYIFLVVMVICAVILLTVISTIEKFWYFVAMGLFILFVVSLRLEVLGIFGLTDRTPAIVALVLYVLPSFYFNRFKTATPFLVRLFIFSGITVLLGLIIFLFSTVEYPFYHLTLTGYTPGLVLSVLFIIMVAHDILASFVYVISQGSSKNLRHLSIISVIYFTNLMITCLHELGVIEWNFVYINLYLLLSVSAVLGVWGFRHREPVYGSILSFSPFGAYFFLAMGAVCFATTAQLLGNANDPALKIIRDAIIFSHTGYGLIFLTYLFSNFVLMLARNMPVYKVLYNPTRMPYFTYRFAGLIVMLAFVFISNWHEYVYHGLAGFYNTAGDLYTLNGKTVYAESFYEQGRSQGFQNHRSNYALATLKASRFNFEAAHYHYDLANGRRPTEYSLINDGNLYFWENNPFGAIHAYQSAYSILPDSGPLANNLGLAYAKVHNLDSALVFLNTARKHSLSKASAETNFFAMATLELLPLKADSILAVFDTASPATIGNALALTTLFHESFHSQVNPLEAKHLNLYTATLLNNYIIHKAKTLDTTFINQANAIVSDSLNADFNEALKASLAFAFYHQGNISRALQILGELVYISQSQQGKFNYIMGLWALEQKNPILASSYFAYADTYDYKEARFYHAIALTEAGMIPEALAAWDTVSLLQDKGEQEIAAQMKRILTLQATETLSLSDADKYQFCRYRIGLRDSVIFNRIINTIENPNYKAQALFDLSQKYFEADELVPAIRFLNRIAGLSLTSKDLHDQIRHLELLMLAYRREVKTLATQINKGITFEARSLEKMLYTGLISETSGDTVAARKNYEILGTYNPYFEEGVIAAADFFRSRDKKSMKPYTILSEAVQVNANSVRLLKAYVDEASRWGFDDYAASATQRLTELVSRQQ